MTTPCRRCGNQPDHGWHRPSSGCLRGECPKPSVNHKYEEETMPIPRDMETIADQVRRAKEDEVGTASTPPVRTFRVRVTPPMAELGLIDGDILHLHADGTLTLEIGTEVFRGAR